mgnify:CR=1 FL=1
MVLISTKKMNIKLVPRTKKVIDLTEKLKNKNLNELIFNGLREANLKILAEIIKSFAETEDDKQAFFSIDNVYDFIDEWIEENKKSYTELYKEVIKVVNDMGFLKTKLTENDLETEIKNPLMNIDMSEIIKESATKAVESIAQEEFRGYKG